MSFVFDPSVDRWREKLDECGREGRRENVGNIFRSDADAQTKLITKPKKINLRVYAILSSILKKNDSYMDDILLFVKARTLESD